MKSARMLLAAPLILATVGGAALAPAVASEKIGARQVAAEIVTSQWQSSVVFGKKEFVKGRVSGAASGEQVNFQRRLPGGAWQTIASTKTDPQGIFQVRVPTRFYSPSLPHRLATANGVVTTPRGVRIAPNFAAKKPAKAWARIDSGISYQFNPCQVIPYRVNVNGEGPGALRDAKAAVRKVSQASGLQFAYKGATGKIYRDGKDSWPRDTNLVISWARDSQTKLSFRQAAAWGGPEAAFYARSPKFGDVAKVTKAGIVIDKAARVAPGPKNRNGRLSRVALIMHELGHTAGLGHVFKFPTQIMSYGSVDQWGQGDLNGFSKVGKASGCLTAPASANARLAPLPPVVMR